MQKRTNLDWEDLKVVLNVAEAGSIRRAAETLSVNRTTVLRRIRRLEQHLNCSLFERRETGYVLSIEAEQVLSAAREVERSVFEVERRIAGRELTLRGEIRVTTTDALLSSTVTPHLATFSRRHPHLTVEVALTNQRLDLTRREADVAIRPLESAPDTLVGKKLADLEFALYAAPAYLVGTKGYAYHQHRWLSVDEPLNTTPVANWMRTHVPSASIALRAGSFLALKLGAECAMGIAPLPCRLGDQSSELVRYGDPLDGIKTQLWIITHADLAQAARIRALMDHFVEAFAINEKTAD